MELTYDKFIRLPEIVQQRLLSKVENAKSILDNVKGTEHEEEIKAMIPKNILLSLNMGKKESGQFHSFAELVLGNRNVSDRFNAWYESYGRKIGTKKECLLALYRYCKESSINNKIGGMFDVVKGVLKQLGGRQSGFSYASAASDYDYNSYDMTRDSGGDLKVVRGSNAMDASDIAKSRLDKSSSNPSIRKGTNSYNRNILRSINIDKLIRSKIMKILYQNYPGNDFTDDEVEDMVKRADELRRRRKENATDFLDKLGRGVIPMDTIIGKAKQNESMNRRVFVVTETIASLLKEEIEMTEYKFNSNIKKFLKELLEDPVNAQPTELLKMHGLTRSNLIQKLIANGILERSERINDKDENGNPKTATMKVKFRVPKKDFDRKMRNLFIKMFESNLPKRKKRLQEDGEGGCMGATSAASSGVFEQPVFPIYRRSFKQKTNEATATTNVGDYEYDVPFIGDKETLARHNGIGGSISMNRIEKKRKKRRKK